MAGRANTPNSLAICLSSIFTKFIPAPSASSSMCSISAKTLGHCLQSLLSEFKKELMHYKNILILLLHMSKNNLTEKYSDIIRSLSDFVEHFSINSFDVISQFHVFRICKPI